MSLAGYQVALADLISSPVKCLAARDEPDAILAPYDLTARERRRIAAVVRQKGMSVNCSLYRSNRVTPLYTLLHFSCLALGPRLEAELDAYWKSVEFCDFQYRLETTRFANFLRRRVENGTLRQRWLPELLDFELASNELRYLPRRRLLAELALRAPVVPGAAAEVNPLLRVARFSCDAASLFAALATGTPDPQHVEQCESFVLLSALRASTPEVLPMEHALGKALWNLRSVGTLSADDAAFAALARMGALVSAQ